MTWIASLIAKIGKELLPWIIAEIAGLFVKLVKYLKDRNKEKQAVQDVQKAVDSEKNAKTAEEQENAFKDTVDKSRGN